MRIVGGALGGFLTWYLLYLGIRRALSKETSGELYFGGFLLAITLASTIFTLLMLWVLVFVDHGGQYLPLSLMIGFFGLSSVGLWAEQIWTRGFIDDRGFGFQSLWRGRRYYEWNQLTGVEYNPSMHWYILRFGNAKPARVSVYMLGLGELLDKLESLGFYFED